MAKILSAFAKFSLSLAGWKIVGDSNPAAKRVVVLAYHTSNWDALLCITCNLALETKASWLAKHTLFWWPAGPLLRVLGGIAVRRHSNEDVVDQVAARFQIQERCIVAMAPEGTRKRVSKWRSGFYYIALKAQVPIQPVAMDYGIRQFVFGPLLFPTGDIAGDMIQIREFLRPFEPKFPELAEKDFTI